MSEKEPTVDGLRDLARSYNAPPEPPRDEMWQAIRTRLREERAQADPRGRPPAGRDASAGGQELAFRRRRWRGWALPLAAAAALALAFGLGRLSSPDGPAPLAAERTTATHYHAAQHMADVETMLSLVSTAPESVRGEETAAWARQLLTTTRLMLDSRAAEDPALRELLEDMELVLVQLANLPGASSADDVDFIRESMEQRELLPRVRNAAGAASVTI